MGDCRHAHRCVSRLSALNAIMGSGRALYQMALDGEFPTWFTKLNDHGVPARAMAFNVVASLLVVLAGGAVEIYSFSNVGYTISFIPVLIGYFLLRQDKPELRRPFKLPEFMKYVALLLAVVYFVFWLFGGLWYSKLGNVEIYYWAGWVTLLAYLPLYWYRKLDARLEENLGLGEAFLPLEDRVHRDVGEEEELPFLVQTGPSDQSNPSASFSIFAQGGRSCRTWGRTARSSPGSRKIPGRPPVRRSRPRPSMPQTVNEWQSWSCSRSIQKGGERPRPRPGGPTGPVSLKSSRRTVVEQWSGVCRPGQFLRVESGTPIRSLPGPIFATGVLVAAGIIIVFLGADFPRSDRSIPEKFDIRAGSGGSAGARGGDREVDPGGFRGSRGPGRERDVQLFVDRGERVVLLLEDLLRLQKRTHHRLGGLGGLDLRGDPGVTLSLAQLLQAAEERARSAGRSRSGGRKPLPSRGRTLRTGQASSRSLAASASSTPSGASKFASTSRIRFVIATDCWSAARSILTEFSAARLASALPTSPSAFSSTAKVPALRSTSAASPWGSTTPRPVRPCLRAFALDRPSPPRSSARCSSMRSSGSR